MDWLAAVMQFAEKLPIERLFVKPPSTKKQLEGLRDILEGAHAKPAESPPENPPEEIPEESEDLKGRLEPRQQKVHLEPPPANGVTTEETVAYQNREIAKNLITLEKHYAQKLTIAGKKCDCLVGGTLIYDNHSPVTIGGIRTKVLSHKGIVQNITQHMDRIYDGDLREIRVAYSNIPLLITPEHPIFGIPGAWKNNWKCQYGGLSEKDIKWTLAEFMLVGSFIAFPRINHTADMEIITPDLAEILGWYVAEGSKDKGSNRIVLSLNKNESEEVKRICNLYVKCFGEPPIIRDRETSVQIEYTNKAFANIFCEFGIGATNKELPEWLLYLPYEKQFRFLRGYFYGDGSKTITNGSQIQATTISEKLAYSIRLLLFRLGILHSVYKTRQSDGLINDRIITGNGVRYNISVSGEAAKLLGSHIDMDFSSFKTVDGKAPMNHGDVTDNYVFLPVKSNEPVPFKGSVYNISVENDESYLTINGAVHNCGSGRHLLAIESLAEETISMVGNPEVYYRLLDWVKKVSPKSTDEAAKSGQYDNEYPVFSREARDFRKELIGSLEPAAVFDKKTEKPSETVAELSA